MTTITNKPVTSSSIAAVGYAAPQRVLEIEFRSGAVYRYFDVPPGAHRELLEAESIGRHFVRRIRPCYRHVRIVAKK